MADVLVELSGWSQLVAAPGIVVLVVVCVPLLHTHLIVSPGCTTGIDDGVKDVPDAEIVCVIANVLCATKKMAVKNNRLFFMTIDFMDELIIRIYAKFTKKTISSSDPFFVAIYNLHLPPPFGPIYDPIKFHKKLIN